MIMPRPKEIRDIPFSQLEMGRTPHTVPPDILDPSVQELAKSIKKCGLLQPVIVAELPEGKYELVTGRRRVLAMMYLQATFIKAVVLDENPDADIAGAIWVSENLVRASSDNSETARIFSLLLKRFGSSAAIADQTGLPLDLIQTGLPPT